GHRRKHKYSGQGAEPASGLSSAFLRSGGGGAALWQKKPVWQTGPNTAITAVLAIQGKQQ
ncbi:MAG: hypothetical protein ABI705_08080, partial [Aestuariivirga sp.]